MRLGAAAAALGVALGAFGAHGLKHQLSEQMMAIYQTAVQYQTSHALGLLLIALLIGQYPRRLLVWAGYLLAGGILLFSGSLYLMVFTAERWLGMITPLGGSAFILGWCLLVFGRLRPPTLDNRQETKQ